MSGDVVGDGGRESGWDGNERSGIGDAVGGGGGSGKRRWDGFGGGGRRVGVGVVGVGVGVDGLSSHLDCLDWYFK